MDLIGNIGNIRNIWGNSNTTLTNLDDTFDKTLLLKLYYPQLLEKNINSLDSYNANINALITKTKEAISSRSFIKSNDNLTMLYEIYNKKTADLPYIINPPSYLLFVL